MERLTITPAFWLMVRHVGQGAGLLLLLEQQGDLGDVGALVADAL